MDDDVRLGRIAGVAVGASWSLLVILALITWILGTEVLPVAAPDAHPAAYWAAAAVTAIAFLACLLAHELAHSVVARGRGIEVEGITLWMFGGMSRLKGEAPDARTEERMALAGPLASLALGAAMTVLAVLLAGAHAPDVLAAAIAWLGLMNGMLAVFNLIPLPPLDGSKILIGLLPPAQAVSYARLQPYGVLILLLLAFTNLLSIFLITPIRWLVAQATGTGFF